MASLLIDIGASIANIEKDMAQAQRAVTGFAKSTERAFAQLGTIAGATGLAFGMQQAISAFMDAEKAAMKMAMAMRNQGDYSKAALADMQGYAAQIQKTTSMEDDAVLAIMANMKTYGMLNDEVKKSTQAAIDLAAAKQDEGMSIERASELIGKAYMGNVTALKKVGIVVDENIPKTEAYNAVMKQIQDRFGGSASAELETYAGQWKQIKNVMGDVAEVVGLGLLKAIEGAALAFNTLSVGFYTGLEKIMGGISWITGSEWAKEAEKNYGDVKDEALRMMSKNYDMLKSFDNVGTAMDKMGKQGTRTMRDLNGEFDKLASETAVKHWKEMIAVMTEFEKESYKVGKSTEQQEIDSLNVRVEKYRQYGADEIKLEEWKQSELKSIMIKANNELIALYEELYNATKQQQYADAAIKAYEEVTAAKREADALMLSSDEKAYILMTSRNKAYAEKFKDNMDSISDAAKSTYQEIKTAAQTAETVSSSSGYFSSGFSTGASSGGYIINNQLYSYAAGEAYIQQQTLLLQQQKLAAEQAHADALKAQQQAAEDAARDALQAQEEYQREQQRLWEEQIAANKALNESMHSQSQTITAWLSELSRGSLSPVQSAGSWGLEYNRLKENAMSGTATSSDLSAFLSYAKDFMTYSKSFSTGAGYQSVYEMIVGDVSKLGDIATIGELLSGMGLGTTEEDLRKVIKAFTEMGVSTKELRDYLTAYQLAATGSQGSTIDLTGSLQNTETPFKNVTDAMNTMAENVNIKLTDVASFFSALASNMGVSFSSTSVGTATDALMTKAYGGTRYSYLPRSAPWVWSAYNQWWVPAGRESTGPFVKDTNMQGQSYTWYEQVANWGKGGRTSGLSIAGEMGAEWVAPTYEPQRGSFLKETGVEDALKNALAEAGAGGPIYVSINIDGREIANALVRQGRTNDAYIESLRRAVN
jgi:hypothetical protein